MEQTTSPDGTVIAFDRLGSGPPLVLVSGAACDRGQDRPVAQALAEHVTVLSYDRRGRGESTDTLPFAVEREIEDLSAVVTAAGAAPIVLGQSSGAALAAHAAAAGLPIRALVMWEPPYAVEDGAAEQARRYASALTERLAAGDRDAAVALFLDQVGMPPEMIAGARQSPHWPGMLALAPTLAYDAAAMGDGGVPVERLAHVDVPALVLAGGESADWFRQAARAAAAAMPHGRYGTLAGQRHDVDPQALAAAVAQLAADLPTTA